MGIQLRIAGDVDRVEISRTIESWTVRLGYWLESIANGPTGYHGLSRQITFIEQHPAAVDDDLHYPAELDRWQWCHAIDHASSDENPPLARTMLISAERADADGDTRTAILDAATAVELSITAWLATRLGDSNSGVVDAIMRRVQMLGPRLQLARDLALIFHEA